MRKLNLNVILLRKGKLHFAKMFAVKRPLVGLTGLEGILCVTCFV